MAAADAARLLSSKCRMSAHREGGRDLGAGLDDVEILAVGTTAAPGEAVGEEEARGNHGWGREEEPGRGGGRFRIWVELNECRCS
jgi:hypothetical protein